MGKIAKEVVLRRVLVSEILGFALVIALIWLDEVLDLPHLFFGAEATPINWRESLFETTILLPLAWGLLAYTRAVFRHLKFLEGFLPICASCKMIRDEDGSWQPLENYIHERSEARFSHGVCPGCAKRLYPDLFDENGTLKTSAESR